MKELPQRLLPLLCLIAIAVAVRPAPAQYWPTGMDGGARVWIEREPDYFRRGDRLDIRFSVPYDSYVTVVHIDPEGNLDFLYPEAPWDVGMVRGGRVHSLPVRGTFANTTIRSRAGIGYLYLLASPYPFDFSLFRARHGTGWDWGYAGRSVHGDPFFAFEQITRFLIPRWPYAPHLSYYHHYYVEGIHRYPTFACSDRSFYDYGWGWTPGFGPCSRLDPFLRQHPYYFDTRRFRGDRRVFFRDFDRFDPRHGFKESPRGTIGGVGTRDGVTDIRSPGLGPSSSGQPRAAEVPRREPAGTPPPQRSTEPQPRAGVPQRAPAPAADTPRRAPETAPTTPQRSAEPPSRTVPQRTPEPPSRTTPQRESGGEPQLRSVPTPAAPAAPASGRPDAPARGVTPAQRPATQPERGAAAPRESAAEPRRDPASAQQPAGESRRAPGGSE